MAGDQSSPLPPQDIMDMDMDEDTVTKPKPRVKMPPDGTREDGLLKHDDPVLRPNQLLTHPPFGPFSPFRLSHFAPQPAPKAASKAAPSKIGLKVATMKKPELFPATVTKPAAIEKDKSAFGKELFSGPFSFSAPLALANTPEPPAIGESKPAPSFLSELPPTKARKVAQPSDSHPFLNGFKLKTAATDAQDPNTVGAPETVPQSPPTARAFTFGAPLASSDTSKPPIVEKSEPPSESLALVPFSSGKTLTETTKCSERPLIHPGAMTLPPIQGRRRNNYMAEIRAELASRAAARNEEVEGFQREARQARREIDLLAEERNELRQEVGELRVVILERDQQIQSLKRGSAELKRTQDEADQQSIKLYFDAQRESLAAKEKAFVEKEEAFVSRMKLLDINLTDRSGYVTDKEKLLEEKEKIVTEKVKTLTEKEKSLSIREEALNSTEESLKTIEKSHDDIRQSILEGEKDNQLKEVWLKEWENKLCDRQAKLNEQENSLAERQANFEEQEKQKMEDECVAKRPEKPANGRDALKATKALEEEVWTPQYWS